MKIVISVAVVMFAIVITTAILTVRDVKHQFKLTQAAINQSIGQERAVILTAQSEYTKDLKEKLALYEQYADSRSWAIVQSIDTLKENVRDLDDKQKQLIGYVQSLNESSTSTDNALLCVTGLFSISTINTPEVKGHIIGEQVVCARDWHISHIYGPTIEDYIKSKIKFERTDTVPVIGEPFN